jgi:hypothetical protein
MKNRQIIHAKLLTVALTALSCGAALAQYSNNLPTTYVYPVSAANTNAPGFTWNVSQVVNGSMGTIAWAESELAGQQGQNLADPTEVYSSASGNATVTTNADLPISFIIPSYINFSIAGPGDCGDTRMELSTNFCEDGMVGTPGNPPDANGGTDNIAAEALTYLSLPAGVTMMGVTSDDGFQLQIGAAIPGDRYSTNAVVVEDYNGTRGHADTLLALNVAKAGLYAARLLYYQGGGNASIEWYSFPAAGTTNTYLGEANTGTNAVLINDIADSGIPAYQSLTAAPLASYCSSFNPSPGSTAVPDLPSFSATLVNGTVPVADITLTIDGTAVSPTITTTASGATVSYSSMVPFSNTPNHTAVLTWNDNGTLLSVTSPFVIVPYTVLSPSQIVTPDTTKPGFKFNVFANSLDYLGSSVNGVQGGDTLNLDNTELGLNGLLTNGNGGFLANMVTLANNGAAIGAAPALGGPSAPAEFIITNTLNLTSGTVPGFPATDGGSDPSHSEVLTYVYIPTGLTTFTLNLDGYYRAFIGSWDYTKQVEIGEINGAITGPTTFSVLATTPGYYPLRFTVFNTDGTPTETLSGSNGGTNALVNDIAHGGLPAYYALSKPSSPYIRFTSPRPVPRQVQHPEVRVLVRLQDSDLTVNDSTAVLNLDGNIIATSNSRAGDVLQMTWMPTNLETPAEIHTGILTYSDSGGNSLSDDWTFLNLKDVWLPTMTPGYYIPTNAVVVETFNEYTDPTAFTNGAPTDGIFIGAPTGQWYKSPQPENPLVDVAPVWTNSPPGPTNWFVWNWDAPGDGGAFDPTDASGPAYANFLCVDLNTFSGIEGSSADTAPNEMINGIPLVALVANPAWNILVAESDNRAGMSTTTVPGQDAGQTQFAMSKQFNLSGVTNPVLAFASIQKQNQDNINSVEYSVDGGATWAPVIYYLDGQSKDDTGDGPDIHVNQDNTVNVVSTLYHDTNPGEVPTWFDSTGDLNNTFAACVAAPISQALAPFFAPRINDDDSEGKRIEVVRLPLAANKSDVRLRIGQIGTCSWYFGVTQIAFYDVAPSGAVVPTGLPPSTSTQPVLSVSAASGQINVTWTGSGTLQSATTLTGNASDWSNVTPAPTGNSYSAPIGAGSVFFRILSN